MHRFTIVSAAAPLLSDHELMGLGLTVQAELATAPLHEI